MSWMPTKAPRLWRFRCRRCAQPGRGLYNERFFTAHPASHFLQPPGIASACGNRVVHHRIGSEYGWQRNCYRPLKRSSRICADMLQSGLPHLAAPEVKAASPIWVRMRWTAPENAWDDTASSGYGNNGNGCCDGSPFERLLAHAGGSAGQASSGSVPVFSRRSVSYACRSMFAVAQQCLTDCQACAIFSPALQRYMGSGPGTARCRNSSGLRRGAWRTVFASVLAIAAGNDRQGGAPSSSRSDA